MFFIVPFSLDGKICFMVEIKIKLTKKDKSDSFLLTMKVSEF